MNAQLSTRLAGPQDAETLKALEAVLQSRSEINFVERLLQSGRSVMLGFIDGRAAGYAVVNWTPAYNLFARLNIPELQDLNVLPDDRGQGLGQAIVSACEELARQRGHAQMGLAVGLTRAYGAAQRLYVRMGYEPDGLGVTCDRESVRAGQICAVDDDLCLMMLRELLP
ncbi:MAG: GNAT family N-acetyltransferase [Micavibrio sp.]